MRSSSRRALSVLAALALVAGSLLAAAPAQAATPIAPTDGAYFEGDSVTLTWNADATSNGKYLVAWWTLGGGIKTRQVTGTTTQLIDLADGTYYWNVSHYTAFGSLHLPSPGPTLDFTVESAPQVNLGLLPGTIGPEGSVTALGTIKDTTYLSANLFLDDVDHGPLATTAVGPLRLFSSTLNFSGAPLAPGPHTVKVVAQDAGGRTSEQSATFTVDGAGPGVSFVSPTDGGWVKGGGADVPVSLSFSELSSWSLYADGGYVAGGLGSSASADVVVDSGYWTHGSTHDLTVEATDLYGNNATPLTISVTVDAVAPEVAFTSPAPLTSPKAGNSYLAKGTVGDEGSGVDPDSVSVRVWSTEFGEPPCGLFHGNYPATVTGGTWAATIDTSALAEGEYCLEVNATDAVGHVGWGDFGYVTVDHGAPGTVTLDTPSNGAMRTSKNVTLAWFAPAGPSEPLTYQYELGTSTTLLLDGSLDGSVSGTGITDLETLVSNLPNGTYYWHARAFDEAGNPGDWSTVWSVHIAAPTPPAPPKKPLASAGDETDEVVTAPTTAPTPSAEPTDKPTAEPTDDGDSSGAGGPEAQDKPADTGFPMGWVIAGVVILVLATLAFFARLLFFRRS